MNIFLFFTFSGFFEIFTSKNKISKEKDGLSLGITC